MDDCEAINMRTPRLDNICLLEKGFTKLICMNPKMVLYLIVYQGNSCHMHVVL